MELEDLCSKIRQLCQTITDTESEARLGEIVQELLVLLDRLIDLLKSEE